SRKLPPGAPCYVERAADQGRWGLSGASVAEVARACEVDANVLHRWRREFRDGVNRAFPGLGKKKAWRDHGSLNPFTRGRSEGALGACAPGGGGTAAPGDG